MAPKVVNNPKPEDYPILRDPIVGQRPGAGGVRSIQFASDGSCEVTYSDGSWAKVTDSGPKRSVDYYPDPDGTQISGGQRPLSSKEYYRPGSEPPADGSAKGQSTKEPDFGPAQGAKWDLRSMDQAFTWLRDTKTYVDRLGYKMPEIMNYLGARDSSTLGTFPAARAFYEDHYTVYQEFRKSLHSVAIDIGRLVAATEIIRQRYQDVESRNDIDLQQMKKILTNPEQANPSPSAGQADENGKGF